MNKSELIELLQKCETELQEYKDRDDQLGIKNTELQSAVLEIELKNVQLQSANEEISSLLRVLSHDITNQIFAVQGFVNMQQMRNDYSTELTQKTFGRVLQSVNSVLSLIDAVRHLRQLEEGKTQLRFTDFPLATLPDQVNTTFYKKLHDKQIEIKFDPNPIPRDWILRVDSLFFVNTIIGNLISNAIKFSHKNSEIYVRIEKNRSITKIVIQDEGVGIPENLLGIIFRMDKPTTREGTAGEIGSGFGMPQVKRFVESMGGMVQIESKAENKFPNEHGTTVTLTFTS